MAMMGKLCFYEQTEEEQIDIPADGYYASGCPEKLEIKPSFLSCRAEFASYISGKSVYLAKEYRASEGTVIKIALNSKEIALHSERASFLMDIWLTEYRHTISSGKDGIMLLPEGFEDSSELALNGVSLGKRAWSPYIYIR